MNTDIDACFYRTPVQVTEALINNWRLPKGALIWEPACGDGAMAEVLKERGFKVTSSDLVDRGYGDSPRDFLTAKKRRVDYVITNPPFHLVELFIKRASAMKLTGFAFLLRDSYWGTKEHARLFEEHRPKYVLPLSWTPVFKGRDEVITNVKVSWSVWEGKQKETKFFILKRKLKPRNRRIVQPHKTLEKVTLNLRKGDKEILAKHYKKVGWSVAARTIIHDFCGRLEE